MRVQASRKEGIGLTKPATADRDPAHEHPQWFELDLDDDLNDPDEPTYEPLPTERHRTIPQGA